MNDARISLAHGNGGRRMRELIEEVFAHHLADPALNVQVDAAHIVPPEGDLFITTDGFTVKPLEFPGGNIGSLAVHGTVNDLSVSGATPLFLTLNAFIEEGFERAQLVRIVDAFARAAREARIRVVAGDTKVVPKGEGSGIYLATTGVGVRARDLTLGLDRIREGDAVLVSGPVGDHGAAVMLAREQFGLRGELRSDAASVHPLTQALLPLPGLRFMRDPTRGGLATVCHEIAHAVGGVVRLFDERIPVRDPVRAVCEMLGYDPLYLACEGRVVAITAREEVERALSLWRDLPEGTGAAMVGQVEHGAPQVIMETSLGGERILEELEDDPLPRIC